MAEKVLKNIKLMLNELNLSVYASSLTFNYSADMLDVTTFADDQARTFLAGLTQYDIQYGGFLNMDPDDTALDALVGASAAVLMSFGVEDAAAVGTIGYVAQGRVATYDRLGSIGDATPYTLSMTGHNFLGRGEVFRNSTDTVTANGANSQLGALSASQTLYSALHVPATVSGTSPTLDVTIESDDSGGFGTPTTRITHTQLIAEGWELSSVAGAVTDDYWRAVITIGGTDTPTFPIFIVLAIV